MKHPRLLDLPNEILVAIFGCLDYKTMHVQVKPSCTHFRDIINNARTGALGDNLFRSERIQVPGTVPPGAPDLLSPGFRQFKSHIDGGIFELNPIVYHLKIIKRQYPTDRDCIGFCLGDRNKPISAYPWLLQENLTNPPYREVDLPMPWAHRLSHQDPSDMTPLTVLDFVEMYLGVANDPVQRPHVVKEGTVIVLAHHCLDNSSKPQCILEFYI